jgi:hypothetical protein
MAEWRKVIVSGSQAELAALTASIAVKVGNNQQITTSAGTTFLSGSFSGSFTGDGSGLTGVTATFPVTAITNLATADKIYVNDGANKHITYGNLLTDLAGTNLAVEGTDSLTLASQISVTGVSASFTGSLTGALIGTASWATNATTATNATNIAVTNTTTGVGPYYPVFVDATTGNKAALVDGTTFTYNATTNTLTVTASYASQALTSSFASTAPWTGIIGTPSGLVSASVLSSPLQGQALLTINGVAGTTVDLGLETGDSPQFVGLTLTGDAAVNGGDVTTTATTATVFNTNATTVNAFGAATALTLGATSGDTTVRNNLTVTGDLFVNGTTTQINTTELFVEDKFIILASGSATAGDGGIVIDRGSDSNANIAFGFDSATDRWGYQNGLTDTTNAMTIGTNGDSAFAGIVFTETAHTSTKPLTGEFVKEGAIYTNTDGTIWMYA